MANGRNTGRKGGGQRRSGRRRRTNPVVKRLMDWTGWKRSARLARGALFVREVRLAATAVAVGFVAGLAVGLWLAPTGSGGGQTAQAPAPAPAPAEEPGYETTPPPSPQAEAEPPATQPAAPAPGPDDEVASLPPADTITPPEDGAPWRTNAALYEDPGGRPMVAVVIDDMGVDRGHSDQAIELPAPLTLAFLPYARQLDRQVTRARSAGHEILVHIPAEPMTVTTDPGPHYLRATQSTEDLRRNIAWNLAQLDGYVGVNNHMGSRFTQDLAAMTVLMGELKRRGLLFVDSRTIATTVGKATAAAQGVPFAERDVFLDNDENVEAVQRQLRELEATAIRTGTAIGIGHPRGATLEALAQWMPEARRRGVAFVPVSAVVAQRRGLIAEAPGG